jgi:hypothetical protein
METHPKLGYELPASAASLQEALPVVLHYHERVVGWAVRPIAVIRTAR